MPLTDLLHRLLLTPSSGEWGRFALILAGLGSVVGVGEFIRKRLGWKAEVTRKFVHVSVGVLIFFAPSLFTAALLPMLLAATFIAVDLVAVRKGLLVGMHGTARYSYGTVFYPFSFLVLIVLFWYDAPEIVSLGMASLALGDAAAAIVGESLPAPHEYRLTRDKKSIEGSATMFVVTTVTLIGAMALLALPARLGWPTILTSSVAASAIATAWEAISSKGLDNFTVPLSVAWVLSFFVLPGHDAVLLQWGIVLAAAISVASWRLKFLTPSGSVATFLLASAVFGIGGWKWTVPILTFFVLSSVLSRLGNDRKRAFENVFEKTGARDHVQVAANGGIPGALILLQSLLPAVDLYPVYVGALAAATADTWGTEVGTYVRGGTIQLPAFRAVPPGTNGGISAAGFLGGVAGAAVIALSAMGWAGGRVGGGPIIAAGVVGALVDSVLGATLQARFACVVCGKPTERFRHCQEATTHTGGLLWMRNDAVNALCGLSGALTALVLR